MKYLQTVLLIIFITFSSHSLATGSKQVPPAAEKSIIEVIVDAFTIDWDELFSLKS